MQVERGERLNDITWTESEYYAGQQLGTPTSVAASFLEATVTTKQFKGTFLSQGPKQPADFWEFLASWGGE